MGVIRVDVTQLNSKADELEALNTQFKKSVDDLETSANSLKSMWEGEANNAFNTAFNSDKVQMNNFYNAIGMYVTNLRKVASKYQQAEATNVEIGNNRTYK